MGEARQAILQALRSGTKTKAGPATQGASHGHAPGPLPALKAEAVEQFCQKLEAGGATVSRATAPGELVDSVMEFLQGHGQEMRLCIAPHPLLAGLAWPPPMAAEIRQVNAGDPSVLTVAAYGIAESGSVVMLSGMETASEANFLPDNFICMVRCQDILAHQEEVWARLRQAGPMPAVVNLISGPSRTADVEQTIQLGAHGPRRMHVIVMD
jgi:L-lactate dehydrogenase complex protein LldG